MTAARPLSLAAQAATSRLGRPGLARCWVAAGPRHGRQQFLKQAFSWKNSETFALLSTWSSLVAAGRLTLPHSDWHAFLCPGRQTAVTRLTAAVSVRQAPAQYTQPQFVTVTGAGGARRALRLIAAAQARPLHYRHYRGASAGLHFMFN